MQHTKTDFLILYGPYLHSLLRSQPTCDGNEGALQNEASPRSHFVYRSTIPLWSRRSFQIEILF